MDHLEPGEFHLHQDDDGYLARRRVNADDPDRLYRIRVRTKDKTAGRIFHRVARSVTDPTKSRRVLVAELNGVRLYVEGDNFVLTTEDLYFGA